MLGAREPEKGRVSTIFLPAKWNVHLSDFVSRHLWGETDGMDPCETKMGGKVECTFVGFCFMTSSPQTGLGKVSAEEKSLRLVPRASALLPIRDVNIRARSNEMPLFVNNSIHKKTKPEPDLLINSILRGEATLACSSLAQK